MEEDNMKIRVLALAVFALCLSGCKSEVKQTPPPPVVEKAPVIEEAPAPIDTPAPVIEAEATCVNACKDYSPSWKDACPEGSRCIQFFNNCTYKVGMAYQVGCNGDGSPGAPQCACTILPSLGTKGSIFWVITDANFAPGDCHPWQPDCLTEGFEVMAHKDTPDCTQGTRIEFSAGNQGDIYGKFDSYNIDVELGFSVPVKFFPDLTCAVDHADHNCRPLWCSDIKCPDAYASPTHGGRPDGQSPQGGCQDTFNQSKGYKVEFCPADCPDDKCPSCQDADPC